MKCLNSEPFQLSSLYSVSEVHTRTQSEIFTLLKLTEWKWIQTKIRISATGPHPHRCQSVPKSPLKKKKV